MFASYFLVALFGHPKSLSSVQHKRGPFQTVVAATLLYDLDQRTFSTLTHGKYYGVCPKMAAELDDRRRP